MLGSLTSSYILISLLHKTNYSPFSFSSPDMLQCLRGLNLHRQVHWETPINGTEKWTGDNARLSKFGERYSDSQGNRFQLYVFPVIRTLGHFDSFECYLNPKPSSGWIQEREKNRVRGRGKSVEKIEKD
ncbi:hypothetical protein RRG08_059108 [Elysia crispata]|uniref:Uncharacterized protein n=1 Tax=Elysia crispata TaxID=231223 RepID=A0AAE1AWV1_9GAST|nr:hypothetical protein RRG08_059108 [Elysia crispata]